MEKQLEELRQQLEKQCQINQELKRQNKDLGGPNTTTSETNQKQQHINNNIQNPICYLNSKLSHDYDSNVIPNQYRITVWKYQVW